MAGASYIRNLCPGNRLAPFLPKVGGLCPLPQVYMSLNEHLTMYQVPPIRRQQSEGHVSQVPQQSTLAGAHTP